MAGGPLQRKGEAQAAIQSPNDLALARGLLLHASCPPLTRTLQKASDSSSPYVSEERASAAEGAAPCAKCRVVCSPAAA